MSCSSVQWTPDGKKLAKWQGNNFLEMFLGTYMEVERKKEKNFNGIVFQEDFDVWQRYDIPPISK